MKKILLFILLIFAFKSSYAKCGPGRMEFFPVQKEISLNSMFIIQGNSPNNQKTINSFKNRKVYLESKSGEIIELKLQEIFNGEMNYLIQAIFKPTKELRANTTYFLKYNNQTENETNEMERLINGKNEKVYWKTTDTKNIEILNPNLHIEFEKTEVIPYGCGPSVNAIFNVKNKSKSEIWYKTEVVETATNKKNVYYIKEWNGKLNVGHGMCSGAFTYNKTGKYKVRFTPMNIDGNSLKTTDWKTFESPFMSEKN